MHPSRFLDLCFVYLGVTFFVVFALMHRFTPDERGISTLVMGIAVFGFGLYRLVSTDEPRVTEYGPVVYFIAALCVAQTIRILVYLL